MQSLPTQELPLAVRSGSNATAIGALLIVKEAIVNRCMLAIESPCSKANFERAVGLWAAAAVIQDKINELAGVTIGGVK